MNAAQRQYTRRFIPLMLGYVALLLASQHLITAWHPTGPLLVTLAMLPAIPLVATMIVFGRYLTEETDEFIRHRHVVAMLWALGALLAVATIWGFLQSADVAGTPPLYLAYPFWCVLYALAQGGQSVADRLAVRV